MQVQFVYKEDSLLFVVFMQMYFCPFFSVIAFIGCFVRYGGGEGVGNGVRALARSGSVF